MNDLIEYKLVELKSGTIIEADGLMMTIEEVLFALREGEAVKKELAELKEDVKNAYFEGFKDHDHLNCVAGIRWLNSDAKYKLEGGK